MTLSVLVPIYNYNALQLVLDLHGLLQRENLDAEIVLADDSSTEHTDWFDKVSQLSRLTLWQAPHNLGRAAIRNKLASLAQGQWLWFVDCDTALPATFSFKAFLDAAKKKGIRLVFTTHDFFPICPKVTMFSHGKICDSIASCEACGVCNNTALSLKKIRILQIVCHPSFIFGLIHKSSSLIQ